MPSFTHTERQVVDKLNAHLTLNEEVSLTELAQECHVSKSTVVKTLQKIGFHGYREFTYNYRIGREQQRGTLLPKEVAHGNEDEIVEGLARIFCACQGKKNIVFLGGRRMGALLAEYVSRKLALFDIFAPATYDYAMVNETKRGVGTAFFFYHRRPDKAGGVANTGEALIESARNRGFRIVLFSDADDPEFAQRADYLVRITPSADPGIDLFATKTIMLIERALARFAEFRKGDDHGAY